MNSVLLIENDDELDIEVIQKCLELKGSVQDGTWQFFSAERLTSRDGNAHIEYWANLLERHKDGKNELLKLGFELTIEFTGPVVEFSADSIAGISRHRIAIRCSH